MYYGKMCYIYYSFFPVSLPLIYVSTGRVVGFSGAPGMWSYVVPGTGSVKAGTASLKTLKRKKCNLYTSLYEDCFFKSNILQNQNNSWSLPIPWSSSAVSCVQKPFSISYSRPWKEVFCLHFPKCARYVYRVGVKICLYKNTAFTNIYCFAERFCVRVDMVTNEAIWWVSHNEQWIKLLYISWWRWISVYYNNNNNSYLKNTILNIFF